MGLETDSAEALVQCGDGAAAEMVGHPLLAVISTSISLFLNFYRIEHRLLGGVHLPYTFDETELKRFDI